MERADRLRIGPWAPGSGRHAEPAATDGTGTAYRLHPPTVDDCTAAAERTSDWLLDLAPYADELDAGGRHYRGCRRAARHPGVLVLTAALVVAASVLLVATTLRGHAGGQRAAGGAGGASAKQSAAGPAVTYQADAPANTLYGSAHARPYPGSSDGLVVQTLGNWGKDVGEGALRINDVVVPATGMYALTVYYVLPSGEPTRSLVITASGSGSISVTVAGNTTCCLTQTVRVELNKGTNSITFSNPAGHAPAIDKVVIAPL